MPELGISICDIRALGSLFAYTSKSEPWFLMIIEKKTSMTFSLSLSLSFSLFYSNGSLGVAHILTKYIKALGRLGGLVC